MREREREKCPFIRLADATEASWVVVTVSHQMRSVRACLFLCCISAAFAVNRCPFRNHRPQTLRRVSRFTFHEQFDPFIVNNHKINRKQWSARTLLEHHKDNGIILVPFRRNLSANWSNFASLNFRNYYRSSEFCDLQSHRDRPRIERVAIKIHIWIDNCRSSMSFELFIYLFDWFDFRRMWACAARCFIYKASRRI